MAARPTHRARADAPRSSVDQDKLQAFMNRARDVVHRSVERNKLASLARVVDEAGDGPSREITGEHPAWLGAGASKNVPRPLPLANASVPRYGVPWVHCGWRASPTFVFALCL
ncbi:hypothetical protein FNF29_06172 [Cafeteria roenbergensis]|uniref:Uncharacterized protein n=1 Tax=Cafeteria roenbergensis TaxID=33653 RepID=A0A5A8C9B3_CAFRO|nr:hypothetical protein FNF29_06172 [Cafeteria roenbergensis]|eukprot:KAA0149084.1 hypothetical protein FNF29_06172 [Cafeteria roenbergensis]